MTIPSRIEAMICDFVVRADEVMNIDCSASFCVDFFEVFSGQLSGTDAVDVIVFVFAVSASFVSAEFGVGVFVGDGFATV